MKILHITQKMNGYEDVELIASRVDEHNSLHAIEKNGKKFMSGGFIINDTPQIRKILDEIPKEDQYEFVKSFKMDPYVKLYADENWLTEK